MLLLFIANFFWILAYDTQYALNDLNDDLKLGINSSAIFLEQKLIHLSYLSVLIYFFYLATMSISFNDDLLCVFLILSLCFLFSKYYD